MYYFWRNFNTTQFATLDAEFRCSSCGFASAVLILGVGHGTGHSLYMLDDEGAALRAHESAEASAESDAADMRDFIGCASCPSCGWIDRRSLARFWLRGALLAAAAAGVFVLIGIALPMIDPGPAEAAHWIATLGAIVALAVIARVQIFQWIGIRRRITFVEPEEEEAAEPEPKKKKKKKRKPVTSTEDA